MNQRGAIYIEIVVPVYSTSISYKGVYHYCSGSTKQILTGPALESFLNGKRVHMSREERIVRGPIEVMERVTEKVTEKEKEVIELLRIDPGYTYANLAQILKVSRKTVSDRIKALKDKIQNKDSIYKVCL